MGCTCGKGSKSDETELRVSGSETRVVKKTTKIVIVKGKKPTKHVEVTSRVTSSGGATPSKGKNKAIKLDKTTNKAGKKRKEPKSKQTKAEKAKAKKSVKEDAKDGLKAHNNYRAKHKVPGLKLNSGLSKAAQKWAETLLKTNRFEHADKKSRQHRGKYVGENIAYYQGGGDYSAADATKSWYDEIQKYSFNAPGTRAGTGHFTQVVWKATKELGIGRAEDPNTGKVIIVGRYLPGGNVVGKYQENVLRPR